MPEIIRKRILKKLTTAEKKPDHYYESLEGTRESKLRVGDYRVIAEICRKKSEIQITLIEHRGRVYKKKR